MARQQSGASSWRTAARAEASGRASAFSSPEESALLKAIERLTRKNIHKAEVPREDEAFQAEAKRAAERAHQALQKFNHEHRIVTGVDDGVIVK